MLVKVPSFSAKEAPGSSTSAYGAVSEGKISCKHEEVAVLQALADVIGIRVAHDRVFTQDVECLGLPFQHAGDHLGDGHADFARAGWTPQAASNFAGGLHRW